MDGLAGQKPGRKPKMDAKDRRIAELEKRNAKLTLAGKLLDLQKSRLDSGNRSGERRGMLMDMLEDIDDPSILIVN